MTARLAVVMSGFPRTSETFAIGELAALAEAGMLTRLYATKPGDGESPQPGAQALLPLLMVLPDGDARHQARAVVADLEGAGVTGLHGYFAHQPAEVAQHAAAALGLDFSFSVHALDARKVPGDLLAERARAAAAVVACNSDVAPYVDVPGARLRLLPHGVDLAHFRPRPQPTNGAGLHVLAVGRLVAKKGLPTLVEAVRRLQVPVQVRIIGTGPERAALEESIERAGVGDRVELLGRRSHVELPEHYAWAHVVAVPSVVDAHGDRDGLPNVALEAMACGRALVASDVSDLGCTVRKAGAGVVVPPGDAAALAIALQGLSPGQRESLGNAGRGYVERHFDLAACTSRFVEHLDAVHAPVRRTADA